VRCADGAGATPVAAQRLAGAEQSGLGVMGPIQGHRIGLRQTLLIEFSRDLGRETFLCKRRTISI